MLFIPIPTSSETPRCPNCGKEEEIIETCAHCGHKYEDEDDSFSFFEIFFLITLIVIALWIICTFGYWILENDPSLLEVFDSQWEYIKGLKIY